MTEIRTTSSTGGQKGVKPERHGLIPRKATDAIARVFGFGASKYADHNWRRGYEWGKSYAALQRHLNAFWDGDTYDEESGLPHLAHAGFHIMVLLTWLEEQGEGVDNVFDTRWPHAMERARLAALAEKAQEDLEAAQSGTFPLRFVAGMDGATMSFEATDVSGEALSIIFGGRVMPCAVEPVFEAEQRDIPTRPYDQSYEDWAADQVSLGGVNASLNLRD